MARWSSIPGCYDPLPRKGSQAIPMSVTPVTHTAAKRAETQREGTRVAAMSAQPMMFSTGRVLVTDGVVYVRELDESDDEVVRIVAESDDPVAAVGRCLKVGARALRAAHVTVDVDVVERSFSALESRFETKVSDAVDEIVRTTTGLLDEDGGALAGTLTTFSSQLGQLLGDTFDADSKSSLLASSEDLVLATMKGLITPEIADSPIGRLKSELVYTVQ